MRGFRPWGWGRARAENVVDERAPLLGSAKPPTPPPVADAAVAAPAAERRVDMPHIQGLRFVAMAWIIVFHYLATDEPGALPGMQYDADGKSVGGDNLAGNLVGHRPLDLFTVISGFATHLAYGNHKKSLGTPVQFLARRASRLVFMYYLTLFLSFFLKLISLGVAAPTMAQVGEEYLSFLVGLLGLNVWVCPALVIGQAEKHYTDTYCWPHNGPLWYIQALIFCWLTYPFLRALVSGPTSVFSGRGATIGQMLAWCVLRWVPCICVSRISPCIFTLLHEHACRWVIGLLPGLLLLLLGLYSEYWLVAKVICCLFPDARVLAVASVVLLLQSLRPSSGEAARAGLPALQKKNQIYPHRRIPRRCKQTDTADTCTTTDRYSRYMHNHVQQPVFVDVYPLGVYSWAQLGAGAAPRPDLVWVSGCVGVWVCGCRVQVFPLFMVPPFYLGVASCELYKLELGCEATGRDGEEGGSGGAEGGGSEERESVWGQVKRSWATVLGETVFLSWFLFQLLPYNIGETHIWALVFGIFLFFFAVSAENGGEGFQVGVKMALSSKIGVMLGDASLCAFTFQVCASQ